MCGLGRDYGHFFSQGNPLCEKKFPRQRFAKLDWTPYGSPCCPRLPQLTVNVAAQPLADKSRNIQVSTLTKGERVKCSISFAKRCIFSGQGKKRVFKPYLCHTGQNPTFLPSASLRSVLNACEIFVSGSPSCSRPGNCWNDQFFLFPCVFLRATVSGQKAAGFWTEMWFCVVLTRRIVTSYNTSVYHYGCPHFQLQMTFQRRFYLFHQAA